MKYISAVRGCGVCFVFYVMFSFRCLYGSGSYDVGKLEGVSGRRVMVTFITAYVRAATEHLGIDCDRMCDEVRHINVVSGFVLPGCRPLRDRDHSMLTRELVRYLAG